MRKGIIIIISMVIPLLFLYSAVQSAPKEGDAKRIIGTWRLVSVVQDGKSDASTGLIYYDVTGHMAVQVMQKSEEKAATTGYVAYFGTYTVDEAKHIVTHHQEGSIESGKVDQISVQRSYEFETDDRLVLMPPGANVRLTWERIK